MIHIECLFKNAPGIHVFDIFYFNREVDELTELVMESEAELDNIRKVVIFILFYYYYFFSSSVIN